tara:strand:+ start:1138 stop:2850 length:1713 start_codon:yes stop_codon:yes gene_type:complete
MKIFIAQFNPIIGDLRGNAKKLLEISSKGFQNSADLVLTPELSLWGYPPKDLLFKKCLLEEQDMILNELSIEIADNYGELGLTIGIAEKIDDKFFPNLYNSIALIEKGNWKIIARKNILPTYEVFDEKRYFRSGNKVSILEKIINKKSWKIGITICEDLWVNKEIEGRGMHKKNPVLELKTKKIDCLINLSASPFTIGKLKNRVLMANNAVKELKIPVLYLNQVGSNDDLIFDGNSFILNKRGEKIKQLNTCKEDFFCWNFHNNEIIISEKNYISDMESVFDALVLGVKDYVKKCGFKTALIGLSGGIDSALVAVIATAALGCKNVFCVAMPSKWNSVDSIIDAEELAKRLNINFDTISIKQLYHSFEETFKSSLNICIEGIVSENIQSRIRGNILMALANKNNHLLLSTGNKSELAVGYCTLYGDMNGGLAVIGDLYKTKVFQLCNWIDSVSSIESKKAYNLPINGKLIGDKIFNKAPSAELSPNQLDTDFLPPYSQLDIILKGIIEEKKDLTQLQNDGNKYDLILKIMKLIKKSEFKRKQAPPILKLSNQSLGNDWRIPIAMINNKLI